MAAQLFIRVRGRVLGPFDHEKLRALAARGQFGRMHEVSEDGVGWVRASQYPELFRVDDRAVQPVEAPKPEPAAAAMIPVSAAPAVAASVPSFDAAPQQGWHYAQNGAQFGPVGFAQLKLMFAEGRIQPDATVWTSGMADWLPAVQVEGLTPATIVGTAGKLSDGVVAPMLDMRPWIILFAVLTTLSVIFSVAGGVFLLILAAKTSRTIGPFFAGQSIGSLISGVLSGFSAYLLFVFAARCRDFGYHRDERTLQAALTTLKTLVVYWGVLTIIAIVLGIILVIYALALA